MKKLILFIFASVSLFSYSESESAPQTTDGAFTTLMIAAADINKYTEKCINFLTKGLGV